MTPVQVATSSRFGSITGDQLTNIQMKGRDVYGLLAVLPGVMDTNLNRDFSTWTSMRDVTINGNPVTSKNVVVDGMSVVDEGGAGNAFVNPNIDAIGEVQVIANGYTAENGRNNGGLIQMTTKSGTSQFRGSGLVQRAPRQRGTRTTTSARSGISPKPLYRVNIPGYSIGGPIMIPGVLDTRASEKKFYFFGSQEFTDDAKPSGIVRSNLPTALERAGDFSQTRFTQRCTGHSAHHRSARRASPFPGNIIPREPHQRARAEDVELVDAAQRRAESRRPGRSGRRTRRSRTIPCTAARTTSCGSTRCGTGTCAAASSSSATAKTTSATTSSRPARAS